MLPKAIEECSKLKAKLDKAWLEYLDQTDPGMKAKALATYRELELTPKEGCKDILRKFCFHLKPLEAWLELPEIKADIEEARKLVESTMAANGPVPAQEATTAEVSAARSRELELRWRLTPAELIYLTGQVPGARDLVLARKLFDEHHDQLDPAFRQSLVAAIPGAKEIAERYARAAAEAEERRQRAESERLTREVARSRWDRCFRDNFDPLYSGRPVTPRIRAISSFVVNQTCGPMPSR